MKLDYTISRIFQEMTLSELETLHQLCDLKRTQILQSLALAVLKIPYADIISSIMKETIYGVTLVANRYHLCMFLKINDVIEESQCSIEIKYILLIHFESLIQFIMTYT